MANAGKTVQVVAAGALQRMGPDISAGQNPLFHASAGTHRAAGARRETVLPPCA